MESGGDNGGRGGTDEADDVTAAAATAVLSSQCRLSAFLASRIRGQVSRLFVSRSSLSPFSLVVVFPSVPGLELPSDRHQHV